jgi:hypothetical protein
VPNRRAIHAHQHITIVTTRELFFHAICTT